MSLVSTIPERCKRCYTCVRECPAKAIKVEGGQAQVIAERCIACGNCVRVCAQKAKQIADGTADARALLGGERRSFACLAPSFPAAFHPVRPGQVVSALRRIGFDEVWEVAFGAELVSREYLRLFEECGRTGRQAVSTPCPALFTYVQKFMPDLHALLAPVVSPMLATARAIRSRHGAGAAVVFIGPCIAKKNEIRGPAVAGEVDTVLTFPELEAMLRESGIDPAELPESGFDSPRCRVARAFAISGGLLRTAGISSDILENDTVVTEGKERVLSALRGLAAGRSKARFFDLLFCEGCIGGPEMTDGHSLLARKEVLADYVREQGRTTTQRDLAEGVGEFAGLDLSRSFERQDLVLPVPSEEQVGRVLMAMRKFRPEDQLNCGACGYGTCRDKAVAVCQGLAESSMCLPFLIEELEETCVRLERSHQELASTQKQLVRSERLASMGQLAAAVAHEINNPLGTVLLYSHGLLKRMRQADEGGDDLRMIASEAARCRDIVRGLLDFARQSRVNAAPTAVGALLEEVRQIMAPKSSSSGVAVAVADCADAGEWNLDRLQVRQMLVNLVANGVDACAPGGRVELAAAPAQDGRLELTVSDNGCGIAEEDMDKLFTPFFTTKEQGKGTGLGLAIAYGVVKMHRGEIWAEANPGGGTKFHVRLPQRAEAGAAADPAAGP